MQNLFKEINAPFVDMVYYNTVPGYNIGGTPKLLKFYEDTGVKFFNLGFIQSTRTISNGRVDWDGEHILFYLKEVKILSYYLFDYS